MFNSPKTASSLEIPTYDTTSEPTNVGQGASGDTPSQNSGETVGEGRIENLRPWAKGTSGNPGGRPQRDVLTEALKAQLASDDSDGRTFAEQIAAVLIKHALRGDVRAIREIADRTEGRPRQQFNIDASATFSDGSPQYDFSRFSDEQLCRLVELLKLAKSGA